MADRLPAGCARERAVSATRPGQQRTGEIVLFLDDDLELLPGALDERVSAFRRDGGREYAGFGCTLVEPPTVCRPAHGTVRRALWCTAMHLFDLPTGTGARVLLPPGFPQGTEPEPTSAIPDLRACPGAIRDVENLAGGDMAVYRDLFAQGTARWDTRLERFNGYALAEDILLCVTVRHQTGLELGRCRAALGVHHAVPGGHGDERARGASLAYNVLLAYNIFLVWSAGEPPTVWRRFQYLRGQLGQVAISLRHGGWQRLHGLMGGWRAIVQERCSAQFGTDRGASR